MIEHPVFGLVVWNEIDVYEFTDIIDTRGQVSLVCSVVSIASEVQNRTGLSRTEYLLTSRELKVRIEMGCLVVCANIRHIIRPTGMRWLMLPRTDAPQLYQSAASELKPMTSFWVRGPGGIRHTRTQTQTDPGPVPQSGYNPTAAQGERRCRIAEAA